MRRNCYGDRLHLSPRVHFFLNCGDQFSQFPLGWDGRECCADFLSDCKSPSFLGWQEGSCDGTSAPVYLLCRPGRQSGVRHGYFKIQVRRLVRHPKNLGNHACVLSRGRIKAGLLKGFDMVAIGYRSNTVSVISSSE